MSDINSATLLRDAFPISLAGDVHQLLRYSSGVRVFGEIKAVVDNEELGIPNRLYADTFDISKAPAMQQVIYYCLFSRSADGYVRETSLRKLVDYSIQNWAVPYLFLALSDYVLEVARCVADKNALRDSLALFAQQNPDLYRLTAAQAISYWNENYRPVYPTYREHPPYQMLESLETLSGVSLSPHQRKI